MLAFASTVILSFSLLRIHAQDFYSLLDMYVFRIWASSSTKEEFNLNNIWSVPGGKSILWEVIVSVIVSEKRYMYMCSIPNGFRDTAISLHSFKIVDKKEILRTVSNAGIYCSSEKLVQFT
jgi:hypothetical protein